MKGTCSEVENKVVVLASSECLKIAAVVERGSPAGLFKDDVDSEWLKAAHALGGLTLLYVCRGEWGLVSRLYLPLTFEFTESPAGGSSRLLNDRDILRVWALAATRGGEALRALEGPLAEPRGYSWRLGGRVALASAGVECLPPYAREGLKRHE